MRTHCLVAFVSPLVLTVAIVGLVDPPFFLLLELSTEPMFGQGEFTYVFE